MSESKFFCFGDTLLNPAYRSYLAAESNFPSHTPSGFYRCINIAAQYGGYNTQIDQVKLGKAQIFIGNELHDDSSIMEYLNNKSHGLVLVMNVFPHDIGTATLSCVASKHNIDKVQRIDKNYIVAGTFSATLVNEQTGDAFKVSGDYNIPLKLKY